MLCVYVSSMQDWWVLSVLFHLPMHEIVNVCDTTFPHIHSVNNMFCGECITTSVPGWTSVSQCFDSGFPSVWVYIVNKM